MSSKRIVLIEDEQSQREALVTVFMGEGYVVHGVESAEEAMSYLMAHPVDIVVTDIKLTGIDGISFYEEMRNHPSVATVPFVFITGYTDPAAIEQVRKLGAAAYITKPYDLPDLLATIERVGREG
jgi:CheY-like chemotaxis protein